MYIARLSGNPTTATKQHALLDPRKVDLFFDREYVFGLGIRVLLPIEFKLQLHDIST
jgi:hypothetical protein